MLKKVFESIRVGNLEIKNRFVVPSMVVSLCNEDGTITERFIDYHEAKAKGGFGLIITENYAITPAGRGFKYMGCIWNDEQMELNKELTKRVHKHGAKIALQIIHAGRETSSSLTGMKIVAPSAIPDPVIGEMPHPLTEEEIKRIIEEFGDAALRAKKAGFDAVELQGAHGYLINQFMSPFSNKRLDKYGGNLMNRARFALEIIENIKSKVGKEYPIMYRISADELIENGLTIEDTKVIVKMLEDTGVSAIDVSVGVYASGFHITAPAAVKHGWEADFAKEFKSVVSIPVITSGRINNPFLAEGILLSEKADMIGMARASLSDPELPNKAKEGRFDEIIECIACRQGCSEMLSKDLPVNCVLNPLTGNEKELSISEAKEKKKVFIIGGGPGGMEAAIVARKRGHEVHLFEKNNELGGQLLLASVPPTKSEITSFVVWQKTQLEKLKANVHLNTKVDEELLKKENPDYIIVATGVTPFIPSIKGVDSDMVVNSNDVLSSKVEVGQNILIVGGGLVGAETAEHLARHSKNVTLVELTDEIARDCEPGVRFFLMKSLDTLNINIMTNTQVKEIGDNKVVVSSNKEEKVIENIDTVIMASGSIPNNKLFEKIKDKYKNISLIGDSLKVRTILDAVNEGYKTALKI
ncbi:MAG: FAD-dependent oxidoreductase [Tepidibacter sp.]|jgi:2,4-dienoyl-CoA reductase-like NADH-dependent reductase (Old Yellow Enzyme family)/thioredoxin reductase|uniref:oxidoreductase n=1 Tax=Tepidibacter sp. TaxID=2529387 RepID=UPI0025DD2342|nr:FAD-dependent oxidoreductase [Tepidibacter sp.]MCT4507698.1 FAD-dependent oxidoreductase [Tepidibacter sp.]